MSPESTDDLTPLVIAAKHGDAAAFARLHARVAPVVYALLLARMSRADAEDAVQEVFLAAWARLADLREPAAALAWLCQIARRQAATSHRRAATRPALRVTTDQSERNPHDPQAREDATAVLETILKLPEAYHEPLILRLVARLSGPQIATALDMTHGSVRVNLTRGFAMLREKLAGAAQGVTP